MHFKEWFFVVSVKFGKLFKRYLIGFHTLMKFGYLTPIKVEVNHHIVGYVYAGNCQEPITMIQAILPHLSELFRLFKNKVV